MMYNIHSNAIRLQIHNFLSDSNSNVCSITRHLRHVHKSNKMKVKIKEKTGVAPFDWKVQFYIGDFFRILATWQQFMQKDIHTHFHTNTHTRVMIIIKICKGPLPKKHKICLALPWGCFSAQQRRIQQFSFLFCSMTN